jgi:hypothetical protein
VPLYTVDGNHGHNIQAYIINDIISGMTVDMEQHFELRALSLFNKLLGIKHVIHLTWINKKLMMSSYVTKFILRYRLKIGVSDLMVTHILYFEKAEGHDFNFAL